MKDVFLQHAAKYPLMQAQDFVKLAYQSAFGCGHMVTSFKMCLDRLLEERQSDTGNVSIEDIGSGYARLYLSGENSPMSTETIAHMFFESADKVNEKDIERFFSLTEILLALSEEGRIPPSAEEIASAVQKFKAGDFSPVSHSDIYRRAYAPAYRVVRKEFVSGPVFSLISDLDKLKNSAPGAIVAIDGMCAAGKTTLGTRLSKALGANLISMDDFFLPMEKRTKERLSTPGGNVDHERFLEEVLLPLKQRRPFSFRPFDCSIMALSGSVSVEPRPLAIVEGSYSCHPNLVRHYDRTVFVSVDTDTQIERIRARNGEKMLRRFINEWIPMENTYFSAFSIKENASFQIHT